MLVLVMVLMKKQRHKKVVITGEHVTASSREVGSRRSVSPSNCNPLNSGQCVYVRAGHMMPELGSTRRLFSCLHPSPHSPWDSYPGGDAEWRQPSVLRRGGNLAKTDTQNTNTGSFVYHDFKNLLYSAPVDMEYGIPLPQIRPDLLKPPRDPQYPIAMPIPLSPQYYCLCTIAQMIQQQSCH